MKVKHSKYKNTGILFELLSRQLTSDTIEGKKPHSLNILKKYFKKGTQLHEEFQYYNLLNTTKYKDVKKADILLETIVNRRSKLNLSKLAKEKFNLIKEIKQYYDLDNFFKAKINNYTSQASIYTLFELSTNTKYSATQIVEQKTKVLENIIKETPKKKTNIFEEFKTYDKDVRLLAYETIVSNFNKKYAHLGSKQKQLLNTYINEVSDTPKLKNYINECVDELRTDLGKYLNVVKDDVVKIKLEEVSQILTPIKHTPKDKDVNNILKYYNLLNELKTIHG